MVAADSEQFQAPSIRIAIGFRVPRRRRLLAYIGDYRHFVLGGGRRGGNYVIPCFGTTRNHGLAAELDSVTPHNQFNHLRP